MKFVLFFICIFSSLTAFARDARKSREEGVAGLIYLNSKISQAAALNIEGRFPWASIGLVIGQDFKYQKYYRDTYGKSNSLAPNLIGSDLLFRPIPAARWIGIGVSGNINFAPGQDVDLKDNTPEFNRETKRLLRPQSGYAVSLDPRIFRRVNGKLSVQTASFKNLNPKDMQLKAGFTVLMAPK